MLLPQIALCCYSYVCVVRRYLGRSLFFPFLSLLPLCFGGGSSASLVVDSEGGGGEAMAGSRCCGYQLSRERREGESGERKKKVAAPFAGHAQTRNEITVAWYYINGVTLKVSFLRLSSKGLRHMGKDDVLVVSPFRLSSCPL